MKNLVIALIVGLLISSCTIVQNVEPTDISTKAELCIIENPPVRETFLLALSDALTQRGIQNRLVPEGSALDSCEWTATYMALWSWDMSIYMSLAEIKIYHNGELDGEALYDSRSGSANMEKFIDAEEKVHELVEQLLQSYQALWKLKKYS